VQMFQNSEDEGNSGTVGKRSRGSLMQSQGHQADPRTQGGGRGHGAEQLHTHLRHQRLEKKQNKLKVSLVFRILLPVTVPSLKETELTSLSYNTFQP